MSHWCEKYIGLPWINGEMDCWGFVRRVQSERFGRQLSVVDIDANDRVAVHAAFAGHPEYSRWCEVAAPADGDCVVVHKGNVADHVGLWVAIDGGKMLHAMPNSGVILSDPKMLRRLGWNPLVFYRFQGS